MNKIKNKWLYIVIALSINLWSFVYFDLKIYQIAHLLIFFFIILYTYKSYKKKLISKDNIIVMYMCLLPILSIISCKILHNQSIISSLIVWRMHIGWLIYFVLLYKNIKVQDIYKAIFFIGIIYTAITLLQQITYPFAPFGARTFGSGYDEKFGGNIEYRMGFYRFVVGGVYYAGISILLYYGYQRNVKKIKQEWIIFFLFILAIIANGYRNIIFAIIISFIYCQTGIKKTIKYLLLCLPLLIMIYVAVQNDITDFIINANEDIEAARATSYIYFFYEYTSNWLSIILGNGVSHDSSQYGEYFKELFTNEIICSDTGLLGAAYYWGAIYICVYFILLIKLLFNKHLDRCFKAILIFMLLPSWTMLPMWEIQGCLLHGIIIYMAHRNIRDNLIAKQNIKNESTLLL